MGIRIQGEHTSFTKYTININELTVIQYTYKGFLFSSHENSLQNFNNSLIIPCLVSLMLQFHIKRSTTRAALFCLGIVNDAKCRSY